MDKKKIRAAVLIFVLVLVSFNCGKNLFRGPAVYTGTLEVTEHNLGAKTAGRLMTLSADEGDTVKKGQLIGTLDRFDQTKKDFERAQEVFDEGGVTEQSLEQAQLSYEDQQIVSPLDGVVLMKIHETGEVLTSGSPVLVVGDTSKLWVRIYVPEGMINRVRMNQEAVIRFDGLKRKYKAHVTYIAPKAEFTPRNVQTPEERITQTFAVKVSLDEPNPDLRPGVAADVTLHG